MDIEPVIALKWLNSILTTDAVLTNPVTGVLGGWHKFPLPGGLRSPFGMVRQHTSSQDLTALDYGSKIWVPLILQVNLYDRERNTFDRISPLAQRVYEILHGAQGQLAGGIVYDCYRVQVHADTEQLGQITENFITQQFAIDALSV
jgi:hypothetical protein